MRRVQLWLTCLIFALTAPPLRAQERINIVASFSILGDFARNVGGDRVGVTTLVGPNSDVHVYTPAPGDARKLSEARLLIVNGLGLEGWLPRLLQSSGSKAAVVTASEGITPVRSGTGPDPHAWQSVENAKIYVENIRDALLAIDPSDADAFRVNTERYLKQLSELDAEVKAKLAQIPAERRKLISTHNAFAYFSAAYGIQFIAPLGVSTDAEPSARDIANIISQIKTAKIPAVFLESNSDPRLMRAISADTGATIGGTLFSDSLTDEKGDCPTYIAMVRHNIKALTSALIRLPAGASPPR